MKNGSGAVIMILTILIKSESESPGGERAASFCKNWKKRVKQGLAPGVFGQKMEVDRRGRRKDTHP